jgi:hypothetical protein
VALESVGEVNRLASLKGAQIIQQIEIKKALAIDLVGWEI